MDTVLSGLERVRKDPVNESPDQRDMREAYMRMGSALMELGRIPDAAYYLELSHDLASKELAAQPDNDLLRERLAVACTWLGTLKQRTPGELQKSFKYYEMSIQLRELIALRGDNERQQLNSRLRPEVRFFSAVIKTNLAESYSRVGLIHYFQQDSARAEGYILKSLALREEVLREQDVRYLGWLFATSPSGPHTLTEWRLAPALAAAYPLPNSNAWESTQNTARMYHLLGEIYFRLNNREKSSVYYEKASMLREMAILADPRNFRLRGDLAQFYDYYGKMNLALGEPKAGVKQLDLSIELFRELLRVDKSVEYKANLAIALYHRGQAAERFQDAAGARKYFAECLAIREALANADPKNNTWQMDLMLVLAHQGQVSRAVKMAEELANGPLKRDRNVPFTEARCYAQCAAVSGDKATDVEAFQKKALLALQAALAAGFKDLVSLESEPDLDSLRSLSAFKEMVDKLRTAAEAAVN